MGSAMASRLLSAGFSLSLYARNPSKASSLEALGAHLAPSPAALALSSDVVFSMVGSPPDVRQIALSDSGVIAALPPGGVFVDHTSSHPALAAEISAAARAKGCWAVDAPVSGGDVGAQEGRLAILAGGEPAVVEWLSPLFEVMGKATYMGPAGCGMSCKIANQIVVAANSVGLSEGLVFAERAGLDTRRFLEAVRGGAAGSMVMELFGERMLGKDFRPGGFAEYMIKDLGMGVNVVEEQQQGGNVAVLPGAALCKQLFSSMVANGDGKLGAQGIITVIQRMNNM